ncbi:MAG: hypothetical protein M3280_02690 [Actinomycetota bacterium]|nr:hypothetical protein [Actinomycetota bacterium]
MPPRLVKVLVALVPALVIPACGSDTVAAGEYMGSVCSEMKAWIEGIQSDAQEVQSLDPQTPAPEQKEKATEFLEATIESTDEMISDVEDAGVPDVENGDQIAEDVVGTLEDARQAYEEANEKVADLSTDDPAAFQQGLSEIGQALSAQGEALRTSMSTLQESEELQNAGQDVQPCQDLAGLTGG